MNILQKMQVSQANRWILIWKLRILRLDKLLAIKALSDSILGILPVISEFQAFMDSNSAGADKTFAGKSPDTVTDRANVCVDKSDDADANSGAAVD